MTRPLRTLAPARAHRDFSLVWGGQAVSQLGSRLYGVAYLLWVLSSTRSPELTGLVTSVTLGAYTIAQLPAGLLADRRDRRLVMVSCDAASAATVLSLAAAAAAGWFDLAHMLAASVILGAAWAVRPVAESTSIPELVPEETVAAAVSLTQTRAWVTGVIGPPLGGVLFGISHPLPFAVDGLSYLTALGCTRLVGVPLRGSVAAPGSKWADIRDGLARFRSVPFIRSTALQAAAMGFVINASGLVVLDMLRHHSTTAAGTGIVLGMASAGGCLGAILAPLALKRIRAPRTALVLAPSVGACGLAGLVVATAGAPRGLAYGALFLFQPLWLTVSESRWLTLVPAAVRGRVRAAISLAVTAPVVVASTVTGTAIEYLGDGRTCAVLAAAMAAVALLALRTPSTSKHIRERKDLARNVTGLGSG